MRKLSMVEALIEAMDEEMARDERVFLIGEDVGTYGSVWLSSRQVLCNVPCIVSSLNGRETTTGADHSCRVLSLAFSPSQPVTGVQYVPITPDAELCMLPSFNARLLCHYLKTVSI